MVKFRKCNKDLLSGCCNQGMLLSIGNSKVRAGLDHILWSKM